MEYRGTLTIRLEKEGAWAVATVADTGCGMDEALQERIFEPFFTTKPAGEGSGLGLDIVRRIVEKHEGRIDVRSRKGEGSLFRVYLPLETKA